VSNEQQKAMKDYEEGMEQAIPEIVASKARRDALAAEARTRIMQPTTPTASAKDTIATEAEHGTEIQKTHDSRSQGAAAHHAPAHPAILRRPGCRDGCYAERRIRGRDRASL
jgi:hypothetical protein